MKALFRREWQAESSKSLRSNRTRLVPASLSCLLLVSVACGGASDGSKDGTVAKSEVVEAEQLLATVDEQISGTIAEKQAQQLVMFVALQQPIKSCMKQAGFTYVVPPFIDIYAGWTRMPLPGPDPVFASTSISFAREHGWQISDWLEALTKSSVNTLGGKAADQAGYEALSDEDRTAYQGALARCTPEDSSFSQAGVPSEANTLKQELDQLLSAGASDPKVKQASATYARCLKAAGFNAGTRDELLLQVTERFHEFWPDEDGRPSQPLNGQAWDSATEFEVASAVADVQCRARTHELVVTKLLPRLREFQTAHINELLNTAHHWSSLIDTAESLRRSQVLS